MPPAFASNRFQSFLQNSGHRLFLCDDHYGNLTDEQRAVARRCRDEMRSVYSTAVLRMILCNEMMCRGMVPDVST